MFVSEMEQNYSKCMPDSLPIGQLWIRFLKKHGNYAIFTILNAYDLTGGCMWGN